MLHNISMSKEAVLLNFVKCKILETKVSWFFIKILSSTTVFNIDLFEQQIKILEWFLKDHVTLKTRVMAAENSALQRKKFFKSFIQIKKKTPNIWPNWKLTYPMLSNLSVSHLSSLRYSRREASAARSITKANGVPFSSIDRDCNAQKQEHSKC